MGSSNGSRFTSKYDERGLVAVVREVAAHCQPDDPEGVSTRAFDAARAGAGHPDLPTAKQISSRLKRPWAQVLRLAGKPDMNVALALSRRLGRRSETEDPWMNEELGVAGLRIVASRLQTETLRPSEYVAERNAIVAADGRRHRHGQDLRLPTEGQIVRIFGDWDAGLERAGLQPRPERPAKEQDAKGVPIAEAIDRCIEKYDVLPTASEVELFARGEGFPLARERPYSRDLEAVGASRASRGLSTPDGYPPTKERPDYLNPVLQTAAKPGEQRMKNVWQDDEVVESMIRFLDWLDEYPGVRATEDRYRAFAHGRAGVASATTVGRCGGHNRNLATASRIRRERRDR